MAQCPRDSAISERLTLCRNESFAFGPFQTTELIPGAWHGRAYLRPQKRNNRTSMIHGCDPPATFHTTPQCVTTVPETEQISR